MDRGDACWCWKKCCVLFYEFCRPQKAAPQRVWAECCNLIPEYLSGLGIYLDRMLLGHICWPSGRLALSSETRCFRAVGQGLYGVCCEACYNGFTRALIAGECWLGIGSFRPRPAIIIGRTVASNCKVGGARASIKVGEITNLGSRIDPADRGKPAEQWHPVERWNVSVRRPEKQEGPDRLGYGQNKIGQIPGKPTIPIRSSCA